MQSLYATFMSNEAVSMVYLINVLYLFPPFANNVARFHKGIL